MHAAGYVLDHSVVRAVADRDVDALNTIEVIDLTGAMTILIPVSVLWPELERPKRHPEDDLLPVDDMLIEMGVVIFDELTLARAHTMARTWRTLTSLFPTTADPGQARMLLMPHVAACALERAWPVLTREPDLWRAAFPDIELDII